MAVNNDTAVSGYSPNGKIVVRGVTLLDYTPGGPDFRPDLFNLTNSNDVLSIQSRYSGASGGTWLQPICIQAGRLVKFSLQFTW